MPRHMKAYRDLVDLLAGLSDENAVFEAQVAYSRGTTTSSSELKAFSKARDQLRVVLADDNVVGLGVGRKNVRAFARDADRTRQPLTVAFFVRKKLPIDHLRSDNTIPPYLPPAISGDLTILTDVVAVGDLRPHAPAPRPPRTIQPGRSIGHVQLRGAGTLGAIVRRGKRRFLLGNSHVLAMSGKAKIGDGILYPARTDKGNIPDDLVADLTEFIDFSPGGTANHVDAAIAAVRSDCLRHVRSSVYRTPGAPSGVAQPREGMHILKVGRTTGRTTGRVEYIKATVNINYPGISHPVRLVNQVLCERYAEPGDSGALILDRMTLKAVGLHVGGSGTESVFTPLSTVLSHLKVKLVV